MFHGPGVPPHRPPHPQKFPPESDRGFAVPTFSARKPPGTRDSQRPSAGAVPRARGARDEPPSAALVQAWRGVSPRLESLRDTACLCAWGHPSPMCTSFRRRGGMPVRVGAPPCGRRQPRVPSCHAAGVGWRVLPRAHGGLHRGDAPFRWPASHRHTPRGSAATVALCGASQRRSGGPVGWGQTSPIARRGPIRGHRAQQRRDR